MLTMMMMMQTMLKPDVKSKDSQLEGEVSCNAVKVESRRIVSWKVKSEVNQATNSVNVNAM